ncbi:MAG: hypothetical protein LBV12_02215 [Puniceicoccales bacterium]|jgi:hypothetical protein|nr:hypothetical protein [Puniceicoccales bacterium]
MKKSIAVLCIVVSLAWLTWHLAAAFLTIQPPSRTVSMIDENGKETIIPQKPYVSIGGFQAVEGTQVIVRNGTIEIVDSGTVYMESPLFATVVKTFSWVMAVLLLVSGLFFYRTTKVAPASATQTPGNV